MVQQISALIVQPAIDASRYAAGADQKVAADKAMVSSSRDAAVAIVDTSAKINASGDVLARLSRQYVDGYRSQERFEQGLRQISRQLDTGKTDIDGATRLLVGMSQKLGVTADASALAANGQMQLAAAVGRANAELENQIALIARARAEQAAENSRQAAAANQNRVNGLLGVGTSSAPSAVASASVFEAEFARLENVAQQRAAQIGQAFGADLESSLIAGMRKSARDSANVFEEELRRIDHIAALKSQQAGAYFQQDLNARFGIGRPVNSASASAEVFANAPGAGGPRLSGNQLQGLGYQANDVATMALLGAPMSQIAFSQGGQILQTLQMGEGGIAGSLNAIKGSAVAAGAALAGMLGTTGLIATGFGAAAVAAGAFYLVTREKAKDFNEILAQQKSIIQSMGPAYRELAAAGQGGPFEDPNVAYLSLKSNLEAARKAAQEQERTALKEVGGSSGTFLSLVGSLPEQMQTALGRSKASLEFDKIVESANKGALSINETRRALAHFGEEHPDFKHIIDRFISMTDAAAATERQVQSLAKTLEEMGNPARARVGNFDRTRQAGLDRLALQRRFGNDPFASIRIDPAADQAAINQRRQAAAAQMQALMAVSPAEKAEAARAEAAAQYNKGESAAARADRIELAGKTALAGAEKSLAEAQKQRMRSLDETVASQQVELGLIGKTASEAEALRMQFQLEQQVRAEAARNNVAVDEAEIARIRLKTAEYARLADQIARAQLRNDLQFERDQVYRTPQDQQIASRLRGTGLSMESDEAQYMRETASIEQRRAAIKDFLTTFQAELTRNGGNIGKAFSASIEQAFLNSMNKQWEHIFDQLANWLAGGLSGTGSGAGGSLLGGILGGGALAAASGGLGAANDNSAAGAVTRAALGAPAGTLGTAMGMVGNYKSGVDARLTDILSTAAERFGGYKVDAFSGFRAGDPRFHGKGLATDVRLTDLASGKVLGNYQDPSTFRAYEQFAQTARQVQLEKYPELADQFRWGGYFGGPRGKYGAMDQMHFDLGGGKLGMAGGSWQGGLTAAQKAMFPGVDSLGLGAAKTSQALDKLAASSASTAKDLTDGLGKLGSSLTQASGLQGGSSGGGLLSGLFDWVGSLFGFADGTEGAPPGWAWVGERGPELRKLRAGDVIRSNARSMQMAADNNNGGGMPSFAPVFNIDARGSTMSRADFEQIADRQARAALAEYQSGQVRGGLGGVQRQFASYKG